MEKEYDFSINTLGERKINSHLKNKIFINDNERIPFPSNLTEIQNIVKGEENFYSMEKAGPRKKLYFSPSEFKAGILTAGGLCPGLNDVIKGVVNTVCMTYGSSPVKGFQYGYLGLYNPETYPPIQLDPDVVDDIHAKGGTILGSSRGSRDISKMVDTLIKLEINALFCVGGDGTLRGAKAIADEIFKRKLKISVIGIPKTIDNDISFTERSFGFESAVYATNLVIESAHTEAKAAYNGVGLIKLMGRESGFIAANATLANSVVNYCLIPEENFQLYGDNGFLPRLFRRLEKKHHAVIVVAEGAGQNFFSGEKTFDKSGNLILKDIGLFLKEKIIEYGRENSIEVNLKYFDPSYTIRSGDAVGTDAVFCIMLAQNAVHAAFAGKTSLMVGYHNGQFVHVPLSLATLRRKKIDTKGSLWQSVLELTGQDEN
ncbi:MAG TPA: ATP-dependent 6-phosphofructokinase [Victivallales bacterium]|nr:ATP-dependent 6-phosphofructokinase [Victivallales bacterium]HPO91173.1 ATP-dependent 6-phosphofructokinase [Victivallales bacterium]HRR27752.1 ATP-dependent 6-phosphofructokinase [Victivallales bacterium]